MSNKISLFSTSCDQFGRCRIGFEIDNYIHWYTTDDTLVMVDIEYWSGRKLVGKKALPIAKKFCEYEGKELKH